jgi:hypothetical protein
MNADEFYEMLANTEHRPRVMVVADAFDRESADMARQALNVRNLSIALMDFFEVMRNAWKYDTLPQELAEPDITDAEKEGFKLAAYYIRPILHRCMEEADASCFMEGI